MKALKTRSTKDVSLWMFIMLSAGILIWIIYGFMIGSLPVIVSNMISLVFAGFILVYKIIYR